jgi:Tfp pilus assembly protein PilX
MRLIHRLRSLKDERGIALVMALGILTVFGISVVTLIDYTTSNTQASANNGARQTAYSLAEAGINDMYGILSKQANNAFSSTLLPSCSTPTTIAYGKGWTTFCGSLPAGSDTWNVQATGKIRNGGVNGTTYTYRTIKATIQIKGVVIETLANQVWNYMFATNTNGTGACDESLASGSNVSSNIYVYGNLCLNNNATITGANTKVVVKGYEKMANSTNYIGTSTTKVAEAHIVGSCTVGSTTHNPCRQGATTAGDQIWANTLDTTPPSISAPTVDWAGYYLNANPGPKYSCYSSSGTVPTFDNDTTRNSSVSTSFDLTPSSSDYDCWTPAGEIGWNHTTKVLTLNGTVFIDGPAKASCTLCSYSGRGALYLSGSFLVQNKFCALINAGNTDCNFGSAWDPNAGPFLTVVANGNTADQSGVSAGQSVVLVSGAHYQGGLYGSNQVDFAGTASDQGPVVGTSIAINGSVTTYPFNLTQAPSGVPDQPVNYGQPQPPQYSSG